MKSASRPIARRRLLGAAAGLGALAGTAALALRDAQRMPEQALQTPEVQAWWAMRFASLDAGAAAVATRRYLGRPLLLNFWATWCPPCRAEMSQLNAFWKSHHASAWQVLGLALDDDAPAVQRFVQSTPVAFDVLWAGTQGLAVARSLGNAQGGLPFSVVFDAHGALRDSVLGILAAQRLARWEAWRAQGLLG